MPNWITQFFSSRRKPESVDPDVLAQYRKRGEDALGAGDLAAAYACYREAVAACPFEAGFYCRLGYVCLELDQVEQASLYLQQAMRLDATAEACYLSGLAEQRKGQTGPAEALFRQALAVAPDFENAYFETMQLLAASGRIEQAIALAEEGIRYCPNSVELLFRLANLNHAAGRADAAAAGLSRIVGLVPQHVEALSYLGMVHLQAGCLDQARAVLEQALAYDPDAINARYFLATLDQVQGNNTATISGCQAVLARQDNHPDANRLLGQALQRAQRFDEAAEHYQASLQADPANLEWQAGLAAVRFAQRDWPGAEACYRQILRSAPDHVEALSGLGMALHSRGEYALALGHFQHAASLSPGIASIRFNIGLIHQVRQDWFAAAAEFRHALELDENQVESMINLGLVLHNLEQFDEAIELLERAGSRRPDDASIWINLGFVCHAGRHEERALEAYRRGLSMSEGNAETFIDMGSACFNLLRLGEARTCFERALQHDQQSASAMTNLGLLALLQGDMEAGWAGYEHRLRQSWCPPRPEFTNKAWRNDAALHGKSIMLYADQGMGDALHFVRYAEQVAALGAVVFLEVHAPLVPLLQNMSGIARVFAQGQSLPVFDFSCPLSSLPFAFATRLESVPAEVPYVKPDPAIVDAWAARAASWKTPGLKDAPRVGIVWAGNPLFHNDKSRSIALEKLLPLFERDDCCFVLLQKSIKAGDASRIPKVAHVIDAGSELADFAQTAGLLANLDLVISVDTAVAHLAGAMGVPCWLALPFVPDFRWLLDRADSPWYPSARLFRQSRRDDWDGVVDAIGKALDESDELQRHG